PGRPQNCVARAASLDPSGGASYSSRPEGKAVPLESHGALTHPGGTPKREAPGPAVPCGVRDARQKFEPICPFREPSLDAMRHARPPLDGGRPTAFALVPTFLTGFNGRCAHGPPAGDFFFLPSPRSTTMSQPPDAEEKARVRA